MSSGLSLYYYLSSVLFLIDGICDMIFYNQFSTCPFVNSAGSMFLYLFILNITLTVIGLQLGYLISFFDNLDPDELYNLGWFKKLIGILVKMYPPLLKVVHYIKLVLVLICINYAFLNNVLSASYLDDKNFNKSTVTDITCLDKNSTTITDAIKSYPKSVLVFESVELASVFITLVFFGMWKNLVDVEGFYYEPENPESGAVKKWLFRKFGP